MINNRVHFNKLVDIAELHTIISVWIAGPFSSFLSCIDGAIYA